MLISSNYAIPNYKINSKQNNISNPKFKAKPSKLVNAIQYNMESCFYNINKQAQSKIKNFFLNKISYPLAKLSIKCLKNTMHYLIDENNKKIGTLMYSYPNKTSMNIDFIELIEQERKAPHTFIDAATIFIKRIIDEGEKIQYLKYHVYH